MIAALVLQTAALDGIYSATCCDAYISAPLLPETAMYDEAMFRDAVGYSGPPINGVDSFF